MGNSIIEGKEEHVSGTVFDKMILSNELNGKIFKNIIINHYQDQKTHSRFILNGVTFINVFRKCHI